MANNVILQLREVAKEKLEQAKNAIKNNSTVFYNGKRYRIQALRLYYSKTFGGMVYQAELIDETPLNWDNVLIVSLCDVEVCE